MGLRRVQTDTMARCVGGRNAQEKGGHAGWNRIAVWVAEGTGAKLR